jgi:hypothetical protein
MWSRIHCPPGEFMRPEVGFTVLQVGFIRRGIAFTILQPRSPPSRIAFTVLQARFPPSRDRIHCPPGGIQPIADRIHCPPGEIHPIAESMNLVRRTVDELQGEIHPTGARMKEGRDRLSTRGWLVFATSGGVPWPVRLTLGCRRRTRSARERRSLFIRPIQSLGEPRKRGREFLGIRAGHILQLSRLNVADGRLTRMGEVPQHGDRILGKRSVEVVEPSSFEQNGRRVRARRLFDHLRRPGFENLGHQILNDRSI